MTFWYQYRLKSLYIIILLVSVFNAQLVYAFQDAIIIQSNPGDIQFSHSTHGKVSCGSCHHSVENTKEIISCRKCHYQGSGKAINARDAFHESCIGCHLREKKENKKSGPAKLCSGCHARK